MKNFDKKIHQVRQSSAGISYKAFSLLELSIVILIFSILATGILSLKMSSTGKQADIETQEKMATIYQALGLYVMKNGFLPCPASILLSKSNSVYGSVPGVAGTCATTGVVATVGDLNVIYGMVPVKALGLPSDFAEDGYGTKIAYVVDKRLTNTTFSTTTAVNIEVLNMKMTSSSIAEADAAFILISYGKNKFGGYNSASTTQINTAATSIDELSNDNADGKFVASSENSDTFDDVLFFKSRNQMMINFNLLYKVDCPAVTYAALDDINGSSYNLSTPFSWAATEYGEIKASTTTCITALATLTNGPKYPTRRCDAFGVWGPVIDNCY